MAETSTLDLLSACVSVCVIMLHALGCTILYVLLVLRSHLLYDLTSLACEPLRFHKRKSASPVPWTPRGDTLGIDMEL